MTYDVILFTGINDFTTRTFGAHKCAHELRLAGFRVLVVGQLQHFTLDELKTVLTQSVGDNTLFVGFSNTFLQTDLHTDKSRLVKQAFENFLPWTVDVEKSLVDHLHSINADCKVVVGGARTFIDINNPYIDYAIIGYADLSIVNLAQHLKDGVPLRKASRNLNKITIINDPIAEGFDFYNSSMQWCNDDIIVPGETLMLEISRGCVFSCKFCNFRLNGKKNVDYLKKYETIRDELIYNYEKYNITSYNLLDDTYNDTKEKIDIMLDVAKSLPFKPKFWAYLRLDLMSKHPETIEKIVDTGIVSMFFGIETLNRQVGATIGKGYNPDEQVKTIQYIKQKYGNQVYLHGSFICGLPGESMQSIQNTMSRLITKEIPLDRVSYRPLQIRKSKYEAWQSAFGLDMTKFGYAEIPWGTDNDAMIQDVNWQSDTTSYIQAQDVCDEFQKKFINSPSPYQFLSNDPGFVHRYKAQLFTYLQNQ